MSEFAPLYKYLPEIAENETRSITTRGQPGLPDDSYAFIESFCIGSDCDCRRAFINVMSEKQRKIVATIGYGWESYAFYRKWFGSDDRAVREFMGVSLPPGTTQGPLSGTLLALFEVILKQDEDYRLRIPRHYAQFKEALAAEHKASPPPPKPDPDTPEACLDVLAKAGFHPEKDWFGPGPERCDSAWEMLTRHPSNLQENELYLIRPALRVLWRHWMPDHPCLEERYSTARGHLFHAVTKESRADHEQHWQAWLDEGVNLIVDAKGNLHGDILRLLDSDEEITRYGRVLDTVLTGAIFMLTPPAFEPALDRFTGLDFTSWENGRRCQVLQGMALVHRGDVSGALKCFDRLARQEPTSVAVHLGAGCALLGVGSGDARLLRQAEWYLSRAEQRLGDADGLAQILTLASMGDLSTCLQGARRITR